MKQFPLFNQLLERIAASRTGQRVWTYYEAAAPREQMAMQVATAAVVLLFIWLLFVAPLHRWSSDARAEYQMQNETLVWMQENRHRISATVETERAAGEALLTLANRTAAQYGISFRRFEPVGETGLSVTLEGAPFNALMQWLGELERSGVVASELSVRRREEPGAVDARIVIEE